MSPDRIRHILKAITWRVVGTIDTVLLGWLITGNLELGLKIGGVEVVTKGTILGNNMFRYKFGLC